MTETIVTSAGAMMELGRTYAQGANGGDVFGLIGTLGTGKTHWTKGFVSLLDPDATVSSPTFGIVNEYRGTAHTVYHFDFYRLKSGEELLALGWDEYLDDGQLVICEWADMFPGLMPENTIWLKITHLPDGSRRFIETEKPVIPPASD